MSTCASPAAICPSCAAPLAGQVLLRGHDRLMAGPGEFAVLRCASCGLASTQPRIGAEQFADYYPAGYHAGAGAGHHAGAGRGDLPDARTRIVERLRLAAILRLGPYRPLSRRPPGRMLDVGCGNGELARAFARRGWRVAGVEPARAAAERARAGGVEVHWGTLEDAPWHRASFDAVVFNHSLEHLPDPVGSLRQAAGLLHEGGVVAVAVPNFACWQRRVFGSRWFGLDLPRHLQHLDASTLAALLSSAGLRPVGRTTASMRPGLLVSLQYAAFGRARFTGRGLRLAAWALAPLLWMLDCFAEGDCLHMFAVAR
jgi:2-polyprenyl-3-methyl-5-hydroxy-6-metoxy-1,4-benzoquinol methylase